ncbi:MAG: GNAT family N-acetyltransferase [Actinomycetota bacterium]
MLEGEKVILRPVEDDDLETLYEFDSDLEVHALADDEPWAPKSREDWEEEFRSMLKKTDENAIFAIEADGALIGSCSLENFDYTARICELGIVIGDRDFWGKGFGRDAVGLLLEYAFDELNMNKVYLTVRSDNERAIRSYEACGFEREGLLRQHMWTDGDYRDLVAMGVLRRDRAKEGAGGNQ